MKPPENRHCEHSEAIQYSRLPRRLCLLAMTIIFLFSPPAFAKDVATPPLHPLQEAETLLKAEKARDKALKEKMETLQKELEDTKDSLVRVAGEIKKNEKELTRLEKRMEQKRREQLEIESRLSQDKSAMSDLILALERMRRVPPEAMLARPGSPLKTAQSAMILESTLPRIYGRAETLREDLDALKNILRDLDESRRKSIKESDALKIRQAEMDGLLQTRKTLFGRTSRDHEKAAAEVKRISARAISLKDLVRKLEENSQHKKQQTEKTGKADKDLPRIGNAQLPVSGIIRINYGQQDEIGAPSEGLHIEGRQGGLVVSPMGGIVRYTGPFRRYGQLIIVEHKKGYHSLVAGLARIDTVVGQSLAAGEPIGILGDANLYYELRYKGRPVNPSHFFR